ncbi:MAG: hypothetical protein ACRCU0_05995 [Candidatus Rhabdochlamydia sp.]
MRRFSQSLASTIQKICYPSICLHCHKLCDGKKRIFCTECFCLINFLEKEERCLTCFSPSNKPYCLACMHQAHIKQAYVSEPEGPIHILLKKVLSQQYYRIPAVAALMAYQYIKLDFPLPDYIIPTYSAPKKLSILLAKEVSKILQVPHRRFFLKKLQNRHVLLTGFQMDQNYKKTALMLEKIHPKTLMGITLIGSSSF